MVPHVKAVSRPFGRWPKASLYMGTMHDPRSSRGAAADTPPTFIGKKLRIHTGANTYEDLDPVFLLREIRSMQEHLVEIADRPVTGEADPPTAPTIEQFLSGLRTAWQDGQARPTDKPKAKAWRGRRRPDPFVAVTAMVREWFEAEPWRTSRELFERLQTERPGVFPDGQLRTLQRRMKEWRRERARDLVFGAADAEETLAEASAPPNI
jgi:hypothetical protein